MEIENKKQLRGAVGIGSIGFFAYAVCYIAKNVLSALMSRMESSGSFDVMVLGNMTSAFLFSYAIGQLINGVLGNKISPRYMVLMGLAVPGTILVLFPLVGSGTAALVLWAVCGFFCSMLWGPLSAMIGENTTMRMGRVLMTVLTVASVIGTLFAYILGVIGSVTNSWETPFRAGGIAILLAAVIWFLGYGYLERVGVLKKRTHRPKATSVDNEPAPRVTFARFITLGLVLMVGVTMLNGVLRNAASTWVPILLERYLGFSGVMASALSTVLPFVNLAGTFGSLALMRFVHHNEKVMCCILFGISTVTLLTVLLVGANAALVSAFAIFLCCSAMTGACNMVFGFYILRYRKTGVLSGLSGFYDFTAYLSATLANLLFTAQFDAGKTETMLLTWVLTAALGLAFSLVAVFSKRDMKLIAELEESV